MTADTKEKAPSVSRFRRAYYSATIADFLRTDVTQVLGHLATNAEFDITDLQRNAWCEEIQLLARALDGLNGKVFLEYSIPRMGKRADCILLFDNGVVVLEFKVGGTSYERNAIDQVIDYATDLKNFHESSHRTQIFPVLIATQAAVAPCEFTKSADQVFDVLLANEKTLADILHQISGISVDPKLDVLAWENSAYRPTPTIIEAAQALYRGHGVEEISRSDAGAYNLSLTAAEIMRVVETSRRDGQKSICFVTGVPGAGKTLAGLNIANACHHSAGREHAVFLSGNGPLVDVLREALARDLVASSRSQGKQFRKEDAKTRTTAFIQNIHHFRDDVLATTGPVVEHLVIFDEAQRAWNREQTSKFMKKKKGLANCDFSEPEFLISAMNRHSDWAVIVCLIGGGQEINTGEAGIEEWFAAIQAKFPSWKIYVSNKLADNEYLGVHANERLHEFPSLEVKDALHLAVSMRSFRAERVSELTKAILDGDLAGAQHLFSELRDRYPIVLTRNLSSAKNWLKKNARGSERIGILASSEAARLKPHGINVKLSIKPVDWFLNDKSDVRSCYYLEDVATEFQIQGLEIDWSCIAWDADLRHSGDGWIYRRFRGTEWNKIGKQHEQRYLKNAYRVLLTRARQGMVIFVPEGDDHDPTRRHEFYDPVFEYLKRVGIPELAKGSLDAVHEATIPVNET